MRKRGGGQVSPGSTHRRRVCWVRELLQAVHTRLPGCSGRSTRLWEGQRVLIARRVSVCAGVARQEGWGLTVPSEVAVCVLVGGVRVPVCAVVEAKGDEVPVADVGERERVREGGELDGGERCRLPGHPGAHSERDRATSRSESCLSRPSSPPLVHVPLTRSLQRRRTSSPSTMAAVSFSDPDLLKPYHTVRAGGASLPPFPPPRLTVASAHPRAPRS